MNPSDENSPVPPEFGESIEDRTASLPAIETAPADRGFAELSPLAAPLPVSQSRFSADLAITWSWAHFIVFLFFGFISLVLVQGVMAISMRRMRDCPANNWNNT